MHRTLVIVPLMLVLIGCGSRCDVADLACRDQAHQRHVEVTKRVLLVPVGVLLISAAVLGAVLEARAERQQSQYLINSINANAFQQHLDAEAAQRQQWSLAHPAY